MATDWTPNLASVPGPYPSIGSSGVAEGHYWDFRTLGMDLIIAPWKIQFGGDGFSPGEGNFYLALPVPCATPPAYVIGYGHAYQAVGDRKEGNVWPIQPVSTGATMATLFLEGRGNDHHVRHDHPFSWKPGDLMHGVLMYMPAAE